MAPKRPTPMEEDPPAADSTTEEEEDDEGSSSSDDASSSEEEKEKTQKPSSPPPPSQKQQQQQPPKKPETITTTTTTTTPAPQSSSESEESESDSDESESEKTPKTIGSPDPNVKPISTKPMKETPKTTKPRSKTTASAATAKSTAKRAIDNDTDRKDPKKAKSSGSGPDDDDSKQSTAADPKKQLFQRLWSESDEIAVLKGMLEYSAKKGADPVTEMNGFLEYIKNSLHFDVTKSQLNDKIRRLKKKYENNLSRGKKGEDPVFSKPHEQKAYEISKKVWGGEAVKSSAASKLNGKAARTPRTNSKASVAELAAASPDGKKLKMKVDEIKGESQSGSEVVLFDKNVGFAGMDEYVIKHGLELVDVGKRAELEERWRKLQLAQLELFVERSELIFDQAKLMLEAAKSSN